MKRDRMWTKFFGALTIVLIIVYLVGDWYLSNNPDSVWIVSEPIYLIYAAIVSAVIGILCYTRKK